MLTAWFDEDQTVEQLLFALSEEGPPREKDASTGEVSVVHGIVQAGQVLSIPSPLQQQAMLADEAVSNCGRVVVITTSLDE